MQARLHDSLIMLFAATSGSVLGSSKGAVKTPQEEMELMLLEMGSCAVLEAQSVLIQQLQAWATPPGSAGRVDGCSQDTEEGCLALCSPLRRICASR